MVKIKRFTFSLIFLVIAVFVNGQTVYNNNATVHCAAGSLVWINGSLQNVGDSLYNLGAIHTAGDTSNIGGKGDLINDGLISGDGKYYVAGNWINNDTFRHGTSEVVMDNTTGSASGTVTNQNITGSKITSFFDLTLVGVGIKTITLNDTVTHVLNLNDRELAVNNQTLFVTNTNPLAITRTLGFISNTATGWLNRYTNVVGPYLFPMGSSTGPMRYRPVEIKPNKNVPSQYIVGFFNYKATLDGYDVDKMDNTFCMVDSLYYHKIDKVVGDTMVDLTIYFDQVTDGPWSGMANWNLNNLNEWTNMGATSKLFSPMMGLTKSNWSTWLNKPYALMALNPGAVQISGSTTFCKGSAPAQYTASGGDPSDTYVWSITGGHIVGDSTHSTVYVAWDIPGTGIISVYVITAWGSCQSQSSSFSVIVYPQPIASFQVIPADSIHIFTWDLIHFVDHSINAVQWHWDFGEGSPSNLENPYHVYAMPGKYNVCLTISSVDNCVDDTCIVVDVVEGIEVPNVFTPNGDGYNDVFDIRASGMAQFSLQVYNRWGALIFESNSANVKWDGRTLAGEPADDGTYFYVLNAKSDSKDYSQHGFVTLLRH
jgi:gliding motility-associated-like protein